MMKILLSLLIGLAAAAFGLLPESISQVSDEYFTPNVSFILYTRNTGNKGAEIFFNDRESIKKAGFSSKLPVVLATHGYMSDAFKEPVQIFRRAFHVQGDLNFIAVDWSKHSKNILYEQAALAVKPVGLYVSKFLRFLTSETGLKIKDFHFIGHSLGAHVASFASSAFPNEKIGRITGSDPASPLFEKLPPEDRLDPGDALFVDVIHTCVIYTGMRKPVGTVDFYPNGGFGQPGCNSTDFTCHHNMSYRFFARTIQTGKEYMAVKCESVKQAEMKECSGKAALLGMSSIKAEPGIYYTNISVF